MEVLYGAMTNEARRLTVKEFFHCYRLAKIAQSKGMYSFVPRSPLLRLECETPDSNRNWKSQYFFMEGDEWMCHPGDTDRMPVDKIWGILPSSSMNLSIFSLQFLINMSLTVFFYNSSPQVSLEEWSFLEKIFNKTKLEEKTWAKLVTLDTLY